METQVWANQAKQKANYDYHACFDKAVAEGPAYGWTTFLTALALLHMRIDTQWIENSWQKMDSYSQDFTAHFICYGPVLLK